MWHRKGRFVTSRYVTNSTLDFFIDEHRDVPGILDVQDDGVRRDAIIVFFDNQKLPKKSLPVHYMGYPLRPYDVRKMLTDTEVIVTRIKNNKNIDLSDKDNKKIYERFTTTLDLCKKLLAKDTKEKSSAISPTA